MNKDDHTKEQAVYNQYAMILNYQPTIKEQHIHVGQQAEKAAPDKTKTAPPPAGRVEAAG